MKRRMLAQKIHGFIAAVLVSMTAQIAAPASAQHHGVKTTMVDDVVWAYRDKGNQSPLRSPLVRSVDAELSYGAIMRASVFRWMKFPKDGETQVMSLRAGFKTNDERKIPDLVREVIVKEYPESL